MSIFGTLDVYNDDVPRSAATNMAIDEALFENVKVPSLRLYRWDHPALSFGYFGRYADVSFYQSERELVRRWTGGGIVLHGDDLTYSIVIPGRDSAFAESSMSIYEKIHRALCNAIVATGQHAVVAAVADRGPVTAPPATAQVNPQPAPGGTPATTKPPATPAPAHDPESEAALVEFLDQQILPYLSAQRGDRFDLGDSRYAEDLFRFVKLRVAEAYRARVEEIQAWCDERRMLDLQVKLQHWLHGWLFVHAPISFLLIMLTAWHAYATLFYY